MQKKMHRHYFVLLLVPSLVILLLGLWMTFYTHSTSMESMQQYVAESSLRATESLAVNIDSLIRHVELSGMNLANQASRLDAVDAGYLAQYMTSIGHSLLTQLNSESFLNTAVDRCYLFLFDKNRVINHTSASNIAEEHYQTFFRVEGMSYQAFKERFSSRYYSGELIAEARIGYLNTEYTSWMLVQSVPLDPTKKPTGLLVFMLDESVFTQRLCMNLADDDALCLLVSEDGKRLVSQGANRHWSQERIDLLLEELSTAQDGMYDLAIGAEREPYLVTVVHNEIGRVISAQPSAAVFGGINHYNTSILLLALGMILLAVAVAMFFSNRNMNAMKRVIDTIAPEHRSGHATNVFSYMQEAIANAQESEALLSAHANEQRSMLRDIFLKRLLHGEWQAESDLLQEQHQADMNLEAKAYVVLLFHFWQLPAERQPIDQTLQAEFGEQAFLVTMSEENVACLLLAEEPDLRESIEAVAEEISRQVRATTLVSGTVASLLDVAQAYRQVRVMSRMIQQDEAPLQWYSELFQDDVLYNFENSVYMETSLRNNIAAGNEQAIRTLLDDLYAKSLKNTVYSDHVLRFFACDLYRMVNHLGMAGERRESLGQLRLLLDSVMEEPQRFDLFFDAVREHCLRLCRANQKRRANTSDETLVRITQYIDAHFMEAELSVGSIAEALGLSGKYLSLFFKEQTNGKISAYIENQRIAHACKLLENTEMTINDIALASGYALTHTFRVAFKKVQGVTPLEWKRTKHQERERSAEG